MNDPKWRRFEQLATHIQRTLAPDARVQHNAMVRGKSGVDRQIDIAVWTRVGQFELFVAIDCKDYKELLDIKDVETFLGEVADVGANKGAMIASRGYTPAAVSRAKGAGLDIYTLIDAESEDWPCLVTMPVLWDERAFAVAFRLMSTELTRVTANVPDLVLLDEDGNVLGAVQHVLARLWNEGRLPLDLGEHQEFALLSGVTFVRDGDGVARVEVRVRLRVERTLRFGYLPLRKIQGLRDDSTGSLHTREFTTDAIVWSEIEAEWEVLPSEDVLAVEPVLRALTTNVLADGHTERGLEPPAWPSGLPLPDERA